MGHLFSAPNEPRMTVLHFCLSLTHCSHQHTASQTERFQLRLVIKGTTLTMGRLYIPFIVRIVTSRTFPSLPGWTSTIRAKGHLVGGIGSSPKHNISPTQMLRDGTGHLDSFCKLVRYSVDQLCRKCRTRAWHKRQRLNADIEVAGDSVFGKASRGAPDVGGLEFKHALSVLKQ